MMKIVVTIPDRHAFFANEVSTGMKLATAPILDPPMTEQASTARPIIRQVFPLLIAVTNGLLSAASSDSFNTWYC